MSTKGRILLRDIFEMLNECLPGWRSQEGQHKIRILYGGRTYPSLPRGEHGKRPGRAEIQKKHVKDLAEFFGILECAQRRIQLLR